MNKLINTNSNDVIDTAGYMLADVQGNMDLSLANKTPLSKIKDYLGQAEEAGPTLKALETIKGGNNNLYHVTNLSGVDSLNTTKKGITYGVVEKKNGKSELAQLKQASIDPTMLIMATTLYEIEGQLNEIIDLSKKIYSFLEHDKEAEIEADIDTLITTIKEYKYNYRDEQFIANNHKHVMDIKRTAKKNMTFYKKQITDDILKDNLVVTNQSMNSILKELETKFKYYRLSLFTYSFSSFLEVILLNNYQEDYLLTKKEELEALDSEYSNNFEMASKFISKNANKSLEGNLLKGLGTTGKALGSLSSKVGFMKDKNVDDWFNEHGEKLSTKGINMKEEFTKKFDEISSSNTKAFISKVDTLNSIHNKTKEIYFDNENIYLI